MRIKRGSFFSHDDVIVLFDPTSISISIHQKPFLGFEGFLGAMVHKGKQNLSHRLEMQVSNSTIINKLSHFVVLIGLEYMYVLLAGCRS